ncbi:hypothetical protein BC834DRAFT_39884 [Gloeopeniophorella convolvens]|nr:hypothetical protein BC834DRAFT_39884 [Gloeopeniophorella convolvens]
MFHFGVGWTFSERMDIVRCYQSHILTSFLSLKALPRLYLSPILFDPSSDVGLPLSVLTSMLPSIWEMTCLCGLVSSQSLWAHRSYRPRLRGAGSDADNSRAAAAAKPFSSGRLRSRRTCCEHTLIRRCSLAQSLCRCRTKCVRHSKAITSVSTTLWHTPDPNDQKWDVDDRRLCASAIHRSYVLMYVGADR